MKKIIFIALALFTFYGCGPKEDKKSSNEPKTQQQIEEEIGVFEKKMKADSVFDKSSAYGIVKAYAEYAERFPKDEKTPQYLFEAGEVSMSLNESINAINYFKQVENNYPTFEKAPYTLFLQGFIYDNHLNEDNQAKDAYNRFLQKFPDHALAKDAKISIDNLGKSDEELIKEFEAKQKKKAV